MTHFIKRELAQKILDFITDYHVITS